MSIGSAEPLPVSSPVATSDEAAERPRVLVVDDDERNLLAIRTVLEDVGDIVEARSGEEALRHLLKGDFAVILLDVYMPGIDGYETAQIIRSREQTKRIPIVFLSAVNKETEHLIRGYSMGAVDYVFKPVDPVVLRSKVAVFVDLFAMRKEIQRKARQEQALLDANLRANAERLRVEQELRLAEQRQAAIIQSLPIVLYLEALDAQPRRPKFVGGNFSALTGYEYEALDSNPGLWIERLHADDRERVVAAISSRPTGRSLAVEYRWQCADGQYRHFLDQAVLLRGPDGTPIEYAGTLLDVTDRKELESQLVQARKMDAIGKLTGGIAHDFNNLLAAVLGGLGLIERRVPLADEQLKILTMTKRAAEQGSDLVGRLLAFARRQQLEPACIQIETLAEAVTDLLAHTLGGLVELEWAMTDDLWCAFADQAQLELALMNLIINARDAMPDGGTISVRAENRIASADPDHGLAPGDYVVLTVADTGCGIAPELLEQVMEPFFTTKDVGKGTGLGLSMVYGFAKQSGGAFRMDSEVGVGTRAEIWLPRAEEQRETGDDDAERRRTTEKASTALRILLVDDHDGVRATTSALLSDLGHVVVEAADGREVLALFEESSEDYDLLITDYAMPHISGAEVIRQVRERRPDLPAIIITGYADAQSIAKRPENVLVLSKPFTPDQLCHAVAGSAHSEQTAVPSPIPSEA
ncbi:response regulator [Sphingosinicella sp. BN140058]|uniref:response regulator n=1 Tax=Sphingosinicella sp. BN140058 TaxID=1892855 RepID=UPI0010119FBB|nr:response regulator [Sphingosinicella sp. BN140058]QAY76595.1 hybrid sensor histidine kinase/response regulator [Sphingosinicella sp. BN140058]